MVVEFKRLAAIEIFILRFFYQLSIPIWKRLAAIKLFLFRVVLSVAYTRRHYGDLIEEILAELPDQVSEGQQFTDLDDQVPFPVRLPADRWVEILNDSKVEFEVAVFSTWRMEEVDPLDIGDIEIADGMHARAGRLALNARITDVRATQLLAALPETILF